MENYCAVVGGKSLNHLYLWGVPGLCYTDHERDEGEKFIFVSNIFVSNCDVEEEKCS